MLPIALHSARTLSVLHLDKKSADLAMAFPFFDQSFVTGQLNRSFLKLTVAIPTISS